MDKQTNSVDNFLLKSRPSVCTYGLPLPHATPHFLCAHSCAERASTPDAVFHFCAAPGHYYSAHMYCAVQSLLYATMDPLSFQGLGAITEGGGKGV